MVDHHLADASARHRGAPGPGARGHVRLCFATSRALLREALQRIDPVIRGLAADAPAATWTVQARAAQPIDTTCRGPLSAPGNGAALRASWKVTLRAVSSAVGSTVSSKRRLCSCTAFTLAPLYS